MNNFFKTILETSRDRLRNPLISSFIFSWLIFNWKGILIILFSKKSIENRIIDIAKEDYSIALLLWFPLSVALFYVIVLPYLSLIIEKLNSYAKRIRKQDLFKDKLEKIIQNKELKEEELKYEKAKIDYNKLAEKHKSTNEISSEEIESFQVEFKQFSKTEDFNVFELVASEIRRYKTTPDNMTNLAIEKIIALGLINKIDDEDNQNTYYILTKKGNFFWKQIMLSKKINLETAIKNKQLPLSNDNLPF